MPINVPIMTQKRHKQVGELRIGQVVNKQPQKLDTFRLTTEAGYVAEHAAKFFNSTAVRVTLANGKEVWEIMTHVSEMRVTIPPGDVVIDQWFKMYSRAGCLRKCDGLIEQFTQQPCMCPADPMERKELAKDGKACKPNTSLRVILPDLPDLGVWKLVSNGDNAAVDLGDTAEMLIQARDAGVYLDGYLSVRERESRMPGRQTYKFCVPVLGIANTMREVVHKLNDGGLAAALSEPPMRELDGTSGELEAPKDSPPVTDSADANEFVDLKQLIMSLSKEDRARLTAQKWKAQFDFASTAVPSNRAEEARQFILSFRRDNSDEEIIDAELIDQ